jgi:hypothetical protein
LLNSEITGYGTTSQGTKGQNIPTFCHTAAKSRCSRPLSPWMVASTVQGVRSPYLQSQTVGDGKNSHTNSGRVSSNVLQPGENTTFSLSIQKQETKNAAQHPTIKPRSTLPNPQALRRYNKVHLTLRYVHHSRTHHE